ncbi:metallophosphoesterase [bacterium]|nr:metallophosphoesterase [bacterium]
MNHKRQYSIFIAVILIIFFVSHAIPQSVEFKAPPLDTATPWTDRPFKNDPDHFQFAIVADRTGNARPGVFEKAMQQLNLLQPEFVICIGDLIEGNTFDYATLITQYDEMDEILNSLEMRFFRVVGNHDISNDVMMDIYHELYTLPYYHFVYKNVLFLIISTEDPPPTHISNAQINYMEKALKENNSVRWTLVFMHKPLFIEQQGELNEGWAKIENALENRPHTLFAGHTHMYAKYKKNGQSYINLATTGGVSNLSGIEAGKFDHIMWITMTDQGPKMVNLLLDGIIDENIRAMK